MVQRVKPLKIEYLETGGDLDYLPTETNPIEDYLSAKGLSFEGLDTYLLEKVGGIVKEKVPDYTTKINYAGNDITSIEVFQGVTQTTPNRLLRVDMSYVANNLVTENWKIYSQADGTTILRTIVVSHAYASNNLINSEVSET
jgi:hypothetical protein